jgi:predicted DNA-binding transcriptional regulator YafY
VSDAIDRHPHARLLVCARRLYEGEPVTAEWIVERFGIGIAAARRDVRWLRMYLPVLIVDGGHGAGRKVSLENAIPRRSVLMVESFEGFTRWLGKGYKDGRRKEA